jgi:D-beta-D-heptose 7-phosphate kinase/D-beta-D-heptose 1-phosphate adenosyltransferase
MNKVILVTGGFDPLHSGHIAYFKAAKELGDHLVVGLNSDEWLTRKKGRPFMPFEERAAIIKELACVDEVIGFNDDDNSASNAIGQVLSTKGSSWKVILANGGDRTKSNIPEYQVYKNHPDVGFAWGVGGEDKKNSSSWILKEWSQPTTERAWGKYTVLDKGDGWQVKQLAFDAGKALSDQRHFNRSEHWHIVEGLVNMELEFANGKHLLAVLNAGMSIDIPKNTWHKATNMGSETARVIEVWMGKELTESDIERRD